MPKQIIVMGAGVGGLSAAIYARLQGYDVLVLEAREVAGGKAAGIQQAGYRLDPGPSIVILTDVYRRLFADAGVPMDEYLRFRRLDPICRVLFGQEPSLDLPADREECLRLLADRIPDDTRALRKLLAKLDRVFPHIEATIFRRPYLKPWQLADWRLIASALPFDPRLTYKQLIDRSFASPLVRSFFYGFSSYGGQTYDSKAAGALLIPYLMMEQGVFYPEGGVAAIPRALAALAERLGIEIQYGRKVIEIEAESGLAKAAVTADGERFEAEGFISNIDKLTAAGLLGRKLDLAPSYSYFTLQWGLPQPMPEVAHHTLVIPTGFESGFDQLYRRGTLPQEPIVYLNNPAQIDPTVVPPGSTSLFAVVTAPAINGRVDWSTEVSDFRSRVLRVLDRAGIQPNQEDADFERIQTPETFQERDGSYLGSLYGPTEKDRLFGLLPLSNLDDELSNLTYCGGSVQPGAGLPMVTLSGKFAAELLSRRLAKRTG